MPYVLPSLLDQDYENLELLIVDQSPNYEAYEFVKKEMPEVFKRLNIQKGRNRMHSGGHNDLINQMTGEYYICASNDMFYPKNFVSSVVQVMETKQDFGFATVKILRWDSFPVIPAKAGIQSNNNSFESQPNAFPPLDSRLRGNDTVIIDSCGIEITQSHQFYDRGQGEEDKGQYDKQKEIFGASGALAIFRKSALDSIAYVNEQGKKEYFDEMLHYKNDIDLSYRLQWAGKKCLFISSVSVYHDRQVATKTPGVLGKFFARFTKSKWEKENSYFGQQVVLLKNFSPNFSWKVHLKTCLSKIASLVFITIFEPFLLRQRSEVEKKLPEILLKKEAMKKIISEKEIERFMN